MATPTFKSFGRTPLNIKPHPKSALNLRLIPEDLNDQKKSLNSDSDDNDKSKSTCASEPLGNNSDESSDTSEVSYQKLVENRIFKFLDQ